MTFKENIEIIIRKSLKQAIQEGRLPDGDYPQIKVEYPKEDKFGDYSTPLALESAKLLRKNPFEIAEVLKEYIEKNDMIELVEVARPGFINIFISFEFMFKNIIEVIEKKDTYGRNKKVTPKKVNLEFVSANPTGPLNVVSARAAAIGDSIANLLEANGDLVDREFYVNDYGNQVRLLGLSVKARLEELQGKNVDFPEDGYQGEYVKDIAEVVLKENLEEYNKIEKEDEKAEYLAKFAIDFNVSTQKEALGKFNVNFTRWFREKNLHLDGDVSKTLENLQSKDVIFEREGKKTFRSTDYGDDKDRVVVRDDGRPTYLLADIAYHNDKVKRGYDQLINIWGPDHHGYIARLSGAMQALGYPKENFKVLIAQQVNLIQGGETVKMSKRLGQFSTMEDLIEEVGVDVSRYFFIMRSLDSHLDFDLSLAKKESSENPVFYLQYAHARISSIFRESEKRNLNFNYLNCDEMKLDNREARNLMKLLIKFPEEIRDAAENYEPHRISNYLLRLAQGFHKLYAEHRILSDDEKSNNSFLALSLAVKTVMRNGLLLLGLNAPERM